MQGAEEDRGGGQRDHEQHRQPPLQLGPPRPEGGHHHRHREGRGQQRGARQGLGAGHHRGVRGEEHFSWLEKYILCCPQGEERRIVLGPGLAWGEQGLGDLVPANSSVVIDVKIDKVERDLVFNFLNQISSGNFNNGK